MREVDPDGEVDGRAICPAREEDRMEDPVSVCGLDRPSEEEVSDDADGLAAIFFSYDGGDESVEGGLESVGGFNQTDDERIRQGVGAFAVGREAVFRTIEWKRDETDVRFLGKDGLEGEDVERGVDDGDGVASSLL